MRVKWKGKREPDLQFWYRYDTFVNSVDLESEICFMLQQQQHKRNMQICIALLFLLSLVPLILVGLHARPTWDDYAFSALSSFAPPGDAPLEHYTERSVRYAVQNGNVFDVLGAVGRTVLDNYRDWQGTFSAIALFSVHPAVLFGANAYPLTMLMTLFALIGATALLLKTILRKNWLIPAILMLTCSIQWLPHIAQGFFWYNGAVYYTFFYSLMLVQISLMIRLLQRKRFFALHVFVIAVLSFFIGGGNFVTALFTLLITALFLLYTLYECRKDRKSAIKRCLPFVLFTILSAVGLILSMTAPGNAVRGDLFGMGFSVRRVIFTIMQSFALMAEDMLTWTNLGIIFLLLVSLPFMWSLLKEMSFSFRYPLLVLVASCLLFAAQNAPPIYAMNYGGDPKLRNIVFFAYIWLLFGNTFYFLGWLQKVKAVKIPAMNKKILGLSLCVAAVCVLLISGLRFSGAETRVYLDVKQAPTTMLTLRDLHQGSPQQFLQEHRLRQNLLENATEPTVFVPAFSAMPLTLLPFEPYCWDSGLMISEATHAPSHWTNRGIAVYYGVNAVVEQAPERTLARHRSETLRFENEYLAIDTYMISDMYYLRLSDVAELVGDLMLLNLADEQVQNAASANGIQPAYLIDAYVLLDGARISTPSFLINGQVFHRYDILLWMDISVRFSGGQIYLESVK